MCFKCVVQAGAYAVLGLKIDLEEGVLDTKIVIATGTAVTVDWGKDELPDRPPLYLPQSSNGSTTMHKSPLT